MPDRSRDLDGTTPIHDDSYTYDGNGNVAAISDGVSGFRGDRDMVYDGLDRLTDVVSPMYGTIGAHYSYDVLDNLTSVTAPSTAADGTHAYCYDAHWRLTNVKAGTCSGGTVIGLGYDVQGNLSNKSGVGYAFDYGNRLRAGGPESYRYDAQGRRVRSNSSAGLVYSLYNQSGQLLFQRDERSNKRRQYIYLGGSLVAEHDRPLVGSTVTVTYQHTDALGSPVATTNCAKVVLQRSEYEPYGYLLNRPMEDGPGYTGHVTDVATGLIYMQQRYLDARIPRFLSADAVTALSDPINAFHRYRYANNNPYKFADFDGRRGRIVFVPVANNPAPAYFLIEMQYLINHTAGAREQIDSILERDININIVYRDDVNNAWRGEAHPDTKTFWMFSDTRRTIEYKVDGKTYILPIGLALRHELDHAEIFSDRDGKGLRGRRAIAREEDEVTERERERTKEFGQPGRRSHSDGQFREIGSPCGMSCD